VTDRLVGRPLIEPPPAPPYQSHELHAGVFTRRQCQRIVDLGLALGSTDATLEGDDGEEVADGTIRDSRTSWISPADDTWWIFEKLAVVAERANRRYGFELTGFGEDLQFTTYDRPGSFYSWHQDGLDGSVAARKLSLVVQLSDPAEYRGCELQFFDVEEDVAAVDRDHLAAATERQGTVIAFPSFEYHRVLPLRGGVRHSLVAWVSGPPFR
jgi:PKHD-type hydroxylase